MADGYMNSHGKPRQPKETQMDQARTLLFDKITETWQCLKCEKKYTKKMQEVHEAMQQHTKRKRAKKKLRRKQHLFEYSRNRTKMKSDYELSDTTEKNIGE